MAVDHLLVNNDGDKLIVKNDKLVTVDDPDDCSCCDPCCLLDAEDAFTGAGDDSGAVNDTEWDCRWNVTEASHVIQITGSKLEVKMNASSGAGSLIKNKTTKLDGDFLIIGKVDVTVRLNDDTVTQACGIRLFDGASTITTFSINKQGADSDAEWAIQVDPNVVVTDWADDFIYFKIERTGTSANNITFEYSDDGITYTDTGETKSNNNALTPAFRAFTRWSGGNFTVQWDFMDIEDGSSNKIKLC